MADTYARDAQARSIRLVDKLLLEIRCGYFLPDETRAGRFDMSRMPTQEEDIWAERFSSEQQNGEQLNTKVDAVLDMATQVATSPDAEPELMIETSSSSSDCESESVQLEPSSRWFLLCSKQKDKNIAPGGRHVPKWDLLWKGDRQKLRRSRTDSI